MKFDQLSGIVLKWAKKFELKNADQFLADLKSDWDAYTEMDEKDKGKWVDSNYADQPLEYLFLRHLKANTIDHFTLEHYLKSSFKKRFDSIEISNEKDPVLMGLRKVADRNQSNIERRFHRLERVLLRQSFDPKDEY